jgi:hypothetical protein
MQDNGATGQGSSGKRRQREVRELLQARDHEALRQWAATDRAPLRTLTSLLFDPDELVVYRAAEAFGVVMPGFSLESTRKQLTHLFWMMNDESGALCWRAPEAIAEILVARQELADEFGRVLLSFIVEEPFEASVCWAITRLATIDSAIELQGNFRLVLPELTRWLDRREPRIRGMAVLAFGALKRPSAISKLEGMAADAGVFTWYQTESGELRRTTVGEAAGDVAKHLKSLKE